MRVPLVCVCRLLPVGGCGETASRRREKVAPGEHQIQGRQGHHPSIQRLFLTCLNVAVDFGPDNGLNLVCVFQPGGAVLLLDLRDVLRLTAQDVGATVLVPLKSIHNYTYNHLSLQGSD